MREIKFRAWDKNNKQITDDFYVRSDGETYEDAVSWNDTPNTEIEYRANYELMQYTGLKDKNGVEIYEGDYVRAFSNINKISDPYLAPEIEPQYKTRVIIYNNGAFVLSDDGKREYSGVKTTTLGQ